MQIRLIGTVIASAILVGSSVVQAAAWQHNAFGRNSSFSWSSVHSTNPDLLGQTEDPGMGSPTVTTSGISFLSEFADDPMNFIVDSNNQQIATDERWVMSTVAKAPVNAGQALHIDGSDPLGAPALGFVEVFETGTYVSDDPENDFVRNQTVFVTIMDPFAFVPTTPLDITFHPNGTWSAHAYVDLLAATGGSGASTIQVDLTNILAISSTAPSTATIRKTSSVIMFPEPGTAVLALFAVPVLLRRRNRVH